METNDIYAATDHLDIDYGVDFERARERLSLKAGKLFREYFAAKLSGAPEADVQRLREAYDKAMRQQNALSARDTAAIRAALTSNA